MTETARGNDGPKSDTHGESNLRYFPLELRRNPGPGR